MNVLAKKKKRDYQYGKVAWTVFFSTNYIIMVEF